jgi:hypothetical protein
MEASKTPCSNQQATERDELEQTGIGRQLR